jgi:hypothetical protein
MWRAIDDCRCLTVLAVNLNQSLNAQQKPEIQGVPATKDYGRVYLHTD